MPKLPQVKPRELINFLQKQGFVSRKTKGGHIFFSHPNGKTTVVPFHNQPLAKGTLKGILKQTDISLEKLLEEL